MTSVSGTAGLAIEDLCVNLARRPVLRNVSLRFQPGRPVLLFGPNGAGKTVLINAVAGLLPIYSGRILLHGVDISRWSAWRRGRVGLTQQFQGLRLFSNATVGEHLMAALVAPNDRSLYRALVAPLRLREVEREACQKARALLARIGLQDRYDSLVKELSYGQQKAVAVLRALARHTDVLFLDEPLAGLSRLWKRRVFDLIIESSVDRAVVVVEHDVATCGAADWHAVFLDDGQVRAQGRVRQLLSRSEILDAYLGSSGGDHKRPPSPDKCDVHPKSSNNTGLVLSNLSAGYRKKIVLRNVSLVVPPGRVVGIVGLNGSGKSTLLNAIFGFAERIRGEITFNGRQLSPSRPHSLARNGLLYLIQDRALMDTLRVDQNFDLIRWLIRPRAVKNRAALQADLGSLWRRMTGSLSGGERQQAAIERLHVFTPELILLDEPSIGLAPGLVQTAAERLHSVWRIAGEPPMLIAEQNLGFLLRVATDIMVLREGRVSAVLPASPNLDRADIEVHLGLRPSEVGDAS